MCLQRITSDHASRLLECLFRCSGSRLANRHQQAFAQLQPALETIDPTLSATIQGRFAVLDKLVEGYRSRTDASGYVLFTTLTQVDKRQLAAAVKAVQEPLSQVASKVANA